MRSNQTSTLFDFKISLSIHMCFLLFINCGCVVFRCAHCKKLKPEWDKVAEHFAVESEEKVAIVSVDVVANPGLYWKYDVTSYVDIYSFTFKCIVFYFTFLKWINVT